MAPACNIHKTNRTGLSAHSSWRGHAEPAYVDDVISGITGYLSSGLQLSLAKPHTMTQTKEGS